VSKTKRYLKRQLTVLAVTVTAVFSCLIISAVYPNSVYSGLLYKEKTIVIIDAGHGGEDGGAVAPDGTAESSLNLAIAKKLNSLMLFLGVPAVMTRTEDISLWSPPAETLRQKKVSDLNNRVRLINSVPDAVLISVHQNNFTDVSQQGAQVFYNTVKQSSELAVIIQNNIREMLNRNNKRLAKPISDGIYIMKNAQCPAVLVECGFLSNSEEFAKLLTHEYQLKTAQAITAGYLRFDAQRQLD